jgi:hypothetical protein
MSSSSFNPQTEALTFYESRRCVKYFKTLCKSCSVYLLTLPHSSNSRLACDFDSTPTPPISPQPITVITPSNQYNGISNPHHSDSPSPITYAQNLMTSLDRYTPSLVPVSRSDHLTGAFSSPTVGYCNAITTMASSAFRPAVRGKQPRKLGFRGKGPNKAKSKPYVINQADTTKPFSILTSPPHSPNVPPPTVNVSSIPSHPAASTSFYEAPPTQTSAIPTNPTITLPTNVSFTLDPARALPTMDPPTNLHEPTVQPMASNVAASPAHLPFAADPPILNVPCPPQSQFLIVPTLSHAAPAPPPTPSRPLPLPIPNWLDISISANQVLFRFWKT